MPNTKSAIRRVRRVKKQTLVNRLRKSRYKAAIKKMDNLLKRRYLYTINFAAQNTNENIAPYLALTQVYNANISLLDSIAIKMTEEVSNSKYGKEFLTFLERRRDQEN